jgi:hypothetical protein
MEKATHTRMDCMAAWHHSGPPAVLHQVAGLFWAQRRDSIVHGQVHAPLSNQSGDTMNSGQCRGKLRTYDQMDIRTNLG